jgi:hypothetical protein
MVLLNTSISSVLCQDQAAVLDTKSFVSWTSRVITDANGWALVPTILMPKPCQIYLFVTPADNTRYQSRKPLLTVGDGASNAIVLTIVGSVIASASASVFH